MIGNISFDEIIDRVRTRISPVFEKMVHTLLPLKSCSKLARFQLYGEELEAERLRVASCTRLGNVSGQIRRADHTRATSRRFNQSIRQSINPLQCLRGSSASMINYLSIDKYLIMLANKLLRYLHHSQSANCYCRWPFALPIDARSRSCIRMRACIKKIRDTEHSIIPDS